MLIWAQHAANERTRTATSKFTKSVSIERWQVTQLVFDDYFLYFSAWVGDRVIHLFKDYWILNPLIVKSFFYVIYEAHRSLMKTKTHNLIIAFDQVLRKTQYCALTWNANLCLTTTFLIFLLEFVIESYIFLKLIKFWINW